MQKEVFGPVVTVQRFEDDEAALAWANDVDYGLSASVWTRDIERALDASRRLRLRDRVDQRPPAARLRDAVDGGFKQSGNGRDMSMHGLEDYTQLKHTMAKHA